MAIFRPIPSASRARTTGSTANGFPPTVRQPTTATCVGKPPRAGTSVLISDSSTAALAAVSTTSPARHTTFWLPCLSLRASTSTNSCSWTSAMFQAKVSKSHLTPTSSTPRTGSGLPPSMRPGSTIK